MVVYNANMGDLSSTKSYETEVRFFISDIELFRQKVEALGCTLLNQYSFTDYYFKPKQGDWDLLTQSLRIREWQQPEKPTSLVITKQTIETVDGISFKKSVYPEGKLTLLQSNVGFCKQVAKDLGFEPLFTIKKKQGWVWESKEKQLEFCAEEVEGLGWTGEFELDGTDIEEVKVAVKRHQDLLEIDSANMSSKPLAVLFAESRATKKGQS